MTNVVQSLVVQPNQPRPAGDATAKSKETADEVASDRDFSSYLSDGQPREAEGEARDTNAQDSNVDLTAGETDGVVQDVEGKIGNTEIEIQGGDDSSDLLLQADKGTLMQDEQKAVPDVSLLREPAPEPQDVKGSSEGQKSSADEPEDASARLTKDVSRASSTDVAPNIPLNRNAPFQDVASSNLAGHLPKQPHTVPAKSAFELTSVPAQNTGRESLEPREGLIRSEASNLATTTSEAAMRRENVPIIPAASNQRTPGDTREKNGEIDLKLVRAEAIPVTTEASAAAKRSASASTSPAFLTNAANLTTQAARTFDDSELSRATTGSLTDLAEFDVSSRLEVQSTSKPTAAGMLSAPDLPKHITQQISTALFASGGKTTEVSLNPAELGRVRISLSSADSGLVISILAERPETLDLMRRNAMQLATEFTDIGYGHVEFNFGQSASGQTGSNEQSARDETGPLVGDPVADEPYIPGQTQDTPVVALDRVDIRI